MVIQRKQKKAYVAPRVVDFGSIEVMTGDCLGLCLDGLNLGFYLIDPGESARGTAQTPGG